MIIKYLFLIFVSNILICKKKVVFLGSSVTAQKDGYLPALQRNYFQYFDFEGYGYGGIAGNPCKFNIAFSGKPDIIIFDWSAIYIGPLAEKYIKAAIFRSKAENAIPAFVLFPRLDRAYIMTTHIKRLSKELNFSVIDLIDSFSEDELRARLLRDIVHTTPLGGIKYAEKIFEFLNNTELKNPVDKIDVEKEVAFPKNIIIDAPSFDFTKIFLNGEIYGMFHMLGPHGNYANIYKDEKMITKALFFDPWCYYSRLGYFNHQLGKINESLTVKILNETFDRKMPERNINWSAFPPKFHLQDICYTGELKKIIVDGRIVFEPLFI
jgi:hypothetical protein